MAYGTLLQRLLRINAVTPFSLTFPAADAAGVLVSDGAGVLALTKNPTLSTPIVDTLLSLTGGQIAFPATQVPSSGANTLDDYEEGTWTPVIGGSGGTSGQTYDTNATQAEYVKIGQLVVCTFGVTLTAKGTITTSVQIQGLPFVVNSGTGKINECTGALIYANLATNWVNLALQLMLGLSACNVQGAAAAAASNNTPLVTADIANNTALRGLIVYRATA